jgi:hypothetical protein
VNKLYRLAIILLASTLFVACGDEEDDLGPGNIGVPDTGNNQPDVDAGVDVGDEVGADVDDNDTGDTSDDEAGSSCGAPTDLGSLAAGQEHSFDANLVAPATSLDSSCDISSLDSGVQVFAFETDVAARVSVWTSLSPSRMDLRQGGCADADDVLTCTDGGNYNFNTSAGETYHLVLWGGVNQGDFEVRLDVTEALCDPSEPNWCENGQMNECRQGTSIDSDDCLDACADDTACGADACEAAIAVDLSATNQKTYTGDQHAYTSTWNASGRTNCGMTAGDDGSDTPNEEAFFEVSGLTAGQELVVESQGTGDFAFFVLEDCDANSCLAAADADVNGNQAMVWEVPDDGSYIVVVEAWQRRSRTLEFSFSTQ